MINKRARLIYNPSAGREAVKKNLHYILEELEKMGYETSAFATKGKDDAKNEAERACEREFDLIISAGGDGTLHEVINGMSSKKNRSKLAILPFGTSNDFARSMGIPKDLEGALEVIRANKEKMIDIGKMNDKFFINIAGGGSLTELTYEVPSKLKTAIGHMAYYIKGIEKITNFKPFKIKYINDGNTKEEEIMLFLISNSNTMGGYEKLAPQAKVDDGKLDVLMLKKCNLIELGRVLTLMLVGEHINDPKVIHFQTEKIEYELEENVIINLDGEIGGISPCIFEVLPKHLKVLVNESIL